MKNAIIPLSLILLLAACASKPKLPPMNERIGGGEFPYQVMIESTPSGSRIEIGEEYIGQTPVTVTIYGDKDGTFHGQGPFIIKANPLSPGEHVQTKEFWRGGWFQQESMVPKRVFFDLSLVPTRNNPTIDVNINK